MKCEYTNFNFYIYQFVSVIWRHETLTKTTSSGEMLLPTLTKRSLNERNGSLERKFFPLRVDSSFSVVSVKDS